MICQVCGIEAPTLDLSFRQNIGLVILRQEKTISGRMCKRCCNKNFWNYSFITLFVGWLSPLSLILAPIYLLFNIYNLLKSFSLEPVPDDAEPPRLTEEAVQRIEPLTEVLFERLNAGEEFERVVTDVALRSQTTPGQVCVYMQAVLAHIEQQKNEVGQV